MKIGLYSPFIGENVGGGERYLLTVADLLLDHGYNVDLVVNQPDGVLIDKFKKSFNLKLAGLKLVIGPFGVQQSAWQRWLFTHQYEVFYYMTDGGIFIPGAKLNVIHFMIPFSWRPGFYSRQKIKFWQVKTANSFFTKTQVERRWPIKIDYVHWGAVDGRLFLPGIKTNTILSVGRFFSRSGNKHCKRQDFLVKTFIKMCRQGLTGWRLILNGQADQGKDNRNYFNQVKKVAKGFPVEFHDQGSFSVLQRDYAKAKIYWHAAGYGVDQESNPQAVEHLGLSTVEAMAAGAVPVVIENGGQPEVVTDKVEGFLWQNQAELMRLTQKIMDSEKLRHHLAATAREKSRQFSRDKFWFTAKQMFKV